MKDALLLLLNRFAPQNLTIGWSHGCAEGLVPTWPNFGAGRTLTTQQLHPAALPLPGAVWWKRNTVCLGLTKSFCFQAAPSTFAFPRKICVHDAKSVQELLLSGSICGITPQILLPTIGCTPSPVAAGRALKETWCYFENARNPGSSDLRHLKEERENQHDPNSIILGLTPSPTNWGLDVYSG